MNLPDFYFQTLGANSAIPFADRFPSSFVLSHNDSMCLIDCGEGSQIKMSEFYVKKKKLDHIFISHLHGDHIFGLPGLLNSLALNGREKSLSIVGPKGIKEFIEQVMRTSSSHLSYVIEYQELVGDEMIPLGRFGDLQVIAFPLLHRVPTYGYRFTEIIEGRNIDPAAIAKYQLSVPEILLAKKGLGIQRERERIDLEEVTLPMKQARSFAYCSDTMYYPEVIPYIRNANLLYHEATYLHEASLKAEKYKHSTAQEAAQIAAQAQVGKLLVGHYSSRYRDLNPLAEEAQKTFKNSFLALQGEIHAIEPAS